MTTTGHKIYEQMTKAMSSIETIVGLGEYEVGRETWYYAEDWQVIQAVRTVLIEHGIAFCPSILATKTTVGKTDKERSFWRHEVAIRCTFTAIEDGSAMVADWAGEKIAYADKGISAAITNAIKQMLLKTFLIAVKGEEKKEQAQPKTQNELFAEYEVTALRAHAWGLDVLSVEDTSVLSLKTLNRNLLGKIYEIEGYWRRYRELLAMADELNVEYEVLPANAKLAAIAVAGKALKRSLEQKTTTLEQKTT